MQIEGIVSFLTIFWTVYVRNPTRPLKSDEPGKFSPGYEWFSYEILLDHANPSNIFNFGPFLNGFCKNPY